MSPTELDHLVPMDFKNVVQVPDTHTWLINNSSSSEESVPLIDLEDPQAVEKIKMACENWGVFQVTNHGVPIELLAQMEHQVRRFFNLTREEKLLTLRKPDSPNGYGIIKVSPSYNTLMWMEGLTLSGSPLEFARRVWPKDYTPFCTVTEDYQEQMRGLAEKITSLIFKSLGISGEDVEWFEPKSMETSLQLNSYPKCPDPACALGMIPHTDSTLITLLYQSNTNRALQAYGPNLKWVDVEPISNAIVVHVGDMMHIYSNGQYKNVLHRAIVSEAHHRISVIYFFGPNSDVSISSPLKFIKNGDFPMYRPITWKEYRKLKLKYLNKSLELVRFNSVVVENANALTSGDEAPLDGVDGGKVEALEA
nr:gibberellin 3-beta-dioxygenase 3-like [Ipomoea batatas]